MSSTGSAFFVSVLDAYLELEVDIVSLGKPSHIYAECKKQFRRLCLRKHPDKPGGDKESFQRLNDAWDFVKDSELQRAAAAAQKPAEEDDSGAAPPHADGSAPPTDHQPDRFVYAVTK